MNHFQRLDSLENIAIRFITDIIISHFRDVLVLVSSSAGTGISKVLKRPRLADKLAVKLFDRKGKTFLYDLCVKFISFS